MNGLSKKHGPLPLWVWLAIAGTAVGLILYARSKNKTAGTSQTNASTIDPSNPLGLTYAQEQAYQAQGIDPNTGTPYSQYGATSGSLGGGGGADTSGGGSAGTQTSPDLVAALQGLTSAVATIPSSGGLSDGATQTQTVPGPSFATELGDFADAVTAIQGLETALGVPATAKPPASTPAGGKPAQPKLTGSGSIAAPYGPKKPAAPKGYVAIGLGNGYWEFRPVDNKKPAAGKGAHGSGAAGTTGHTNSKTVSRTTTHVQTHPSGGATVAPPKPRVIAGKKKPRR